MCCSRITTHGGYLYLYHPSDFTEPGLTLCVESFTGRENGLDEITVRR
ncbi:MAG: hypothetical protein ACI88C_002930 [Acidimicrobiales bacterium]|jgi:hypothetical protein